MSFHKAIKAIKLNEIILYKNNLNTKELNEFKVSENIYLDDESNDSIMFLNDESTLEVEIFEWKEYKVELKNNESKFFSTKDFLDKGYYGTQTFGTIYLKNFSGILNFRNNHIIVSSKKITKKDLNSIIDFVNEYITNIVFDFNKPISSSVKRNNKKKSNVDYYSFLYIMHILKTDDKSSSFYNSFGIIEKEPHRIFSISEEYKNISEVSEINEEILISMFNTADDLMICKTRNNTLTQRFQKDSNYYLPQNLIQEETIDTFDNPENRFVKFFIKNSLMILEKFYIDFTKNQTELINQSLVEDVKLNIDKLQQILRFSFLNHVKDLNYIPSNSTVLTKKLGYKNIFKFHLGMNSLPENIFEKINFNEIIENKALDVIYEIYSYLSIVKIIAKIYDVKIETLSFKVKQNKYSQSLSKINYDNYIIFDAKDKLPRVELHYNKTYSPPDSYSKQFDPDISLEVFDENKKLNRIMIFDAKFKIDLSKDARKFKEEDIAKMHSYKDAIKLAKVAYVLYPGKKDEIYNENLSKDDFDGVGALSLTPSNCKNFIFIKNKIKGFLEKEIVLENENFKSNILNDLIKDNSLIDYLDNLDIKKSHKNDILDLNLENKLNNSSEKLLEKFDETEILNHESCKSINKFLKANGDLLEEECRRFIVSSASIIFYTSKYLKIDDFDYSLQASGLWKAIEVELNASLIYLIRYDLNICKFDKYNKKNKEFKGKSSISTGKNYDIKLSQKRNGELANILLGSFPYLLKNVLDAIDLSVDPFDEGDTRDIFVKLDRFNNSKIEEDLVVYIKKFRDFTEKVVNVRNPHVHKQLMKHENFKVFIDEIFNDDSNRFDFNDLLMFKKKVENYIEIDKKGSE